MAEVGDSEGREEKIQNILDDFERKSYESWKADKELIEIMFTNMIDSFMNFTKWLLAIYVATLLWFVHDITKLVVEYNKTSVIYLFSLILLALSIAIIGYIQNTTYKKLHSYYENYDIYNAAIFGIIGYSKAARYSEKDRSDYMSEMHKLGDEMPNIINKVFASKKAVVDYITKDKIKKIINWSSVLYIAGTLIGISAYIFDNL